MNKSIKIKINRIHETALFYGFYIKIMTYIQLNLMHVFSKPTTNTFRYVEKIQYLFTEN